MICCILLASLFETNVKSKLISDNTSHVHHNNPTAAPWGTDGVSHFLLSGRLMWRTGYTQVDTCHVCYQPHQISSLTVMIHTQVQVTDGNRGSFKKGTSLCNYGCYEQLLDVRVRVRISFRMVLQNLHRANWGFNMELSDRISGLSANRVLRGIQLGIWFSGWF